MLTHPWVVFNFLKSAHSEKHTDSCVQHRKSSQRERGSCWGHLSSSRVPQLQDFHLDLMMAGPPWKDWILKSPVKEQSVKQPPPPTTVFVQSGLGSPWNGGQYDVFSSGKHFIVK